MHFSQHFGNLHRHFAWQAQHFRRVVLRVLRIALSCRAASSGDNVLVGKRRFCGYKVSKFEDVSHETLGLKFQLSFRFSSCLVASPCLWGKLQNLSVSKVSKQAQCHSEWQARHVVTFSRVCKWCRKSFCVTGRRNTFARFSEDDFHVSWQLFNWSTLDVSMFILRGRRSTLDVSCCVFFTTCIVRAASSGDNVQIAWQAWDIARASFCMAGAVFCADPLRLKCYVAWCGRRSISYTLHFTLPTLHFTLHTLLFTLHTVYFTFSTPHSTLHTLHFTLHTLHFTVHTAHFTLHTLHFTLHTPRSTLYTAHSTLYTPHSTLDILHSTLYTSHLTLTLYTPHFALYTLHSTLYTLHITLYTSHFTLHTLQSTLYTLHSTLYILHSRL